MVRAQKICQLVDGLIDAFQDLLVLECILKVVLLLLLILALVDLHLLLLLLVLLCETYCFVHGLVLFHELLQQEGYHTLVLLLQAIKLRQNLNVDAKVILKVGHHGFELLHALLVHKGDLVQQLAVRLIWVNVVPEKLYAGIFSCSNSCLTKTASAWRMYCHLPCFGGLHLKYWCPSILL